MDDDSFITFEEYMDDPINSANNYSDYLHEIIFQEISTLEFLDNQIRFWEQYYIDIRLIIWKKELVQGIINDLKLTRTKHEKGTPR